MQQVQSQLVAKSHAGKHAPYSSFESCTQLQRVIVQFRQVATAAELAEQKCRMTAPRGQQHGIVTAMQSIEPIREALHD